MQASVAEKLLKNPCSTVYTPASEKIVTIVLFTGSKDKRKITVLTMTDMFASIINKVYNYEEISSSFIN